MKDQLITFLRRSIWFLLNLQRYHIKTGKFPKDFEVKFWKYLKEIEKGLYNESKNCNK